MYALDINKLINWMLPAALRKSAMVIWLNVLLGPVKIVYDQFILFSNQARLDLKITGQVRVLEYHLNRIFTPGVNGCYITDSVGSSVVFIYTESENQPVYLPTFISGQDVDFIVNIPKAYAGADTKIRAFLNKFKLPSKRYEIRYYV